MFPQVRYFSVGSALVLAALLAGCETTSKPSGHFAANGTKGTVAVVSNDSVILDLPAVRIADNTVFITGTVHRKSGVTGDLPGRVDIEFLSADGQYLDGLPALLVPNAVPAEPTETAKYSTSYGYVPPVGSIIRVHFVDRETQIKEDLEGTDFSYGGSNAPNGGYASAGGKPITEPGNKNTSHSINYNHGNRGFDSGFGTNNFGATRW